MLFLLTSLCIVKLQAPDPSLTGVAAAGSLQTGANTELFFLNKLCLELVSQCCPQGRPVLTGWARGAASRASLGTQGGGVGLPTQQPWSCTDLTLWPLLW